MKAYILIAFGLILSLACVLFLAEAIRSIDVDGLEYNLSAAVHFGLALLTGLIGIPLFLKELDKKTKD